MDIVKIIGVGFIAVIIIVILNDFFIVKYMF